jgi:endogenous inhibitor of DNA gyrase (YacG/DUF329 family)
MAAPTPATTVSCPTCGDLVTWAPESRFRPFCSDRCRLLDLGAWFEEERAIPDESSTPLPAETSVVE